MDAGALELQLRRLPGVVSCHLTATEVVLLLGEGDPAAIHIAAQATLDQARSGLGIRVLAATPAAAPVAPWRRRRFAVLAGAAGALSAGIAAASTLASMPGVPSRADDVAIAVPEAEAAAGGGHRVRTFLPARTAASSAVDPAAEGQVDVALVSASAPSVVASAEAGAVVPFAPSAPAARPSTPVAPSAPAPAPAAEPGDVAAASDEDDDRGGQGRGRDGRPAHPHGEPPGYLQRAGHGPW